MMEGTVPHSRLSSPAFPLSSTRDILVLLIEGMFILSVDVTITSTTFLICHLNLDGVTQDQASDSFLQLSICVSHLIGHPVLGPGGDPVIRILHQLSIVPLLLVDNQSSLGEDVVDDDVHDNVMPCVDLADTFLHHLTMCFPVMGSPVLLH